MENDNYKLPKGWTETKIADNAYITHIPKEHIDKWRLDRWKKDDVDKILKEQGFVIRSSGRTGRIYYVENDKLCEIEFEISGVKEFDILLYFDSFNKWLLPQLVEFTYLEKKAIKEKLIVWLKAENIKADL